MVKLTVERRGGQSYLEFVIVKFIQFVLKSLFSLVGTESYTLAAVNTTLLVDNRMSVLNSYRLGGTALDAVGTALTLVNQKRHGMLEA